jgi:hypothetical protein
MILGDEPLISEVILSHLGCSKLLKVFFTHFQEFRDEDPFSTSFPLGPSVL